MTIPQSLANLSPQEKRAVLTRLLEQKAARKRQSPLSFGQRQLWFMQQLAPTASAYHIGAALHLEGVLLPAVFEASLREIVRRHDTLRTSFSVVDGEPVQEIAAAVPFAVTVVDMEGLPAECWRREASRVIPEALHSPFDLGRAPLLRVLRLRLSARESIVLLAMHHIISDGWSLGILIRELGEIYTAFCSGRPSPLAPLPAQYTDFVRWQQQWLSSGNVETQLDYWRERLRGDTVLALPADRPRPAARSFHGGKESFSAPLALYERLTGLGQEEGATPFMTLLAVFHGLLYRYSGQTEIRTGSPIAGRNRRELEGVVGFFVNMLVLQTDFAAEPTFRQLVAQVREAALDAYANQDLPFSKLVEALQPSRALSHTPLFQVSFSFQSFPGAALAMPGLVLRPFEAEHSATKFDLILEILGGGRDLGGSLEYSRDLFDRPTIVRLLGHFEVLLAGLTAAPEARLSELPLLTSAERTQIEIEWNDTRVAGEELCLHELFAAAAGRTPDALAVVAQGKRLTYGELEERANHLAHRLRRLGVGPETPVGLLADRSAAAVLGILAIWKAGGAYVPLDPAYPRERMTFLLADCGARLLLTAHRDLGDFERAGLEHIEISPEGEGAAEPPRGGAVPDNLAYAIYTSGSTGRPKGALIPHRAVVNLLRGLAAEAFGAWDRPLRVGLNAPLIFDASVQQLVHLALGNTLYILPEEARRDTSELAQLLAEHRLDLLDCTPSQLRVWLEGGIFDGPSAPARVLVGGEAIDPPTWRTLSAKTGTVFFNVYGPTECTVNATIRRIDREASRPSIGRPLPGLCAHVLDSGGRSAAIGVPGELGLAGCGLARGYLGRADLTAERFTPHPLGFAGERLYRTGDQARWLPGGSLEILGRLDQQVKIRGFRIEPGEIEATLAQHPKVREAVVEVRELSPGDRRLVAYVVAAAEAQVSSDELRAFAVDHLPEPLVPAAFVLLEEMPRTRSGKVDRRSLPEVDWVTAAEDCAPVAPRSEVEELLAELFAAVLQVPRIGLQESFFDAGGHSILAMQLTSRIRQTFGIKISVRRLFEQPTVAGLAPAVWEAKRAGAAKAPAIEPVPRGERLPLSFSQQRLWFLDQLAPGSSVYNLANVVRLQGSFSPRVLAASLGEIARRHESLRTTFAETGGDPVQVIAPPAPFPLPAVDLRGLAEPLRLSEARRVATAVSILAFDLERGPLLRVILLALGERDHAVVLTLHHIIGDRWSTDILVRELRTIYGALSAGRPSPLPELPVQYADFAAWQRRWLSGESLEAELGYWRGQLAGLPVLDLPTDRARPAVQTANGAIWRFAIPRALTAALSATARAHSATQFMTLLAAFEVLLGRYTGQDDIVLGTPIAGRNPIETEPLIGFFVNTLVARADLSADPGFGDLLAQVRETMLTAYQHQDLPFEKLVEELRPERDLSRTPLFQVVFALQNAPRETLALPGLAFEPLAFESGTAKFDLTLLLSETGSGLAGLIEYNRDLFDASRVSRMAGHFLALLDSAVAAAGQRISQLPLLTAAERHQALLEWNDFAVDCPQEPLVHELVALHARRSPQALAVASPEARLTYGELEERSALLARLLRSLGVGPEVLVAICTERTLDRVVGIVAVLKAGGAYVSLDPGYPRERLAFLLEDAGAPVLLTESRFLAALPESGARVLCLDGDWEREAASAPAVSESAGRPAAGPANLAYVVYTSGSTGRPKGVAIPHAGLMNLVRWHQRQYGVTAEDRGTQVASPAFDASIWELWPYLTAGASVHIPDEETRLSSAGMVRWWEEESITLAYLMTPLAEGVLEERVPRHLPVRALIIGGDRLHRGPDPQAGFALMNHYGPAEYTVTSTVVRVPVQGEGSGAPSIGRPVDNTRIYVLDRRLEPVGVGVSGELFVGGLGIARGYLGRPELTAEKFVPDPFGGEPGGRLYRTADLVRYLSSGELDFLGRLDHQVKVRGLRIELGEIETVLGQHPAVREAAVLVREDRPGDKRLVAYVAVAGEVAVEELRALLKERLPEYMVPAAFLYMESLPLTPNGKVDRRALPAPSWAAQASYVAPRNAAEERVAALFAEVLEIERVGVEDNFFDLGGHSLLAMKLASRLREAFGVELPVRTVFEAPTPAGLAGAAAGFLGGGAAVPRPPIERVSREHPLPLSYAQQRLWFLDRLSPGGTAYNIAAAVRLKGRLDLAAFAAALSEIVRRHEVLRTRFVAGEEGPVQVVSPAAPLDLPLLDLSGLTAPAVEARRLAAEEAGRPFDLTRGPLLRAALIALSGFEHLVLLSVHHAVSDGWSHGILLGELATLYAAFSRRLASPLPELAIQYGDFAAWQQRYLSGEALAADLAYWRQRLAEPLPTLELPTDRPRPAVQTFRGAGHPFRIPADLVAALAALTRGGVTLFMVLLAAFEALLARYSGQQDFTVGTPVAGRNRLETEPLIGPFINTLVLRADLAGDPSFAELLARVRETTLEAYAHQELPFEQLIEALRLERDLSRPPLVQVVFTLQESLLERRELAGLELDPLVVPGRTAKLDLTLSVARAAEGLAGACEHNRDLFDATTATRISRHFVHLLASLAGDPGRRLSQLPLLDAAERAQVLREWNDTQRECPQTPMVHELFALHAACRPQAPAIVSDAGALTYAEVEARANRLAHHLRSLGVGPETLVAICTERTLERVVGIVAVLKAGGAYVSLDPTYPRERLAFLIEDAQAPVLLTQKAFAGLLPDCAAAVIRLDGDWGAIVGDETRPPASGVGPDNLAYVVYTSGSTGRPKGVEIPHAGLMNLVRWHQSLYGVTPEDHGTQIASPAFDASIWELWPYLSAGACLHIPDEETRLSSPGMLRWWAREGITLAYLMTPLAEGVLEEEIPPHLDLRTRALIIGGDRLHRRPRREAGFRLMNHYGPAEYSVTSTVVRVPPEGESAGIPSIGRPVDNTRIYVLDRSQEPVPVGVHGELYVAGTGLARGYLRRPDLTAEKFVPDPFAEEPGARMYRTADLVRSLPDGDLDFLGRLDHQVKLRGLRIELGEIENVLAQHPGLREVAVLVREDRPGDRRLTAYLVASGEPGPTADELRSFLADRLPEYMVPAAFVALASLPLTPNGKVDRRALPAPALSEAEDLPKVAPRTRVELELACLWEEILDRRPIGVHDNFFELGGHSLLAARLMARIEARFGRAVPLAALFRRGTLEDLASFLEEEAETVAASPLVPLRTTGGRPPCLFVHPASGSVAAYRQLARHLGSERPFYGLQAMGIDTDQEPQTSVEEMAAWYLDAVLRLVPRGPYHLGGWSFGALVAFEMARQLRERGEEVATLVVCDTPAPGALPESDEDEAETLARLATDAGLPALAGTLRQLTEENRLLHLADLAVQAGFLPEGVAVRHLRRRYAVYKATHAAARRYRPVGYDGPLTLLRATIPINEEVARFAAGHPKYAWEHFAPAVTVHEVPGTHLSLMAEPQVRELADVLLRILDGAGAARPV